MMWRLIKGMVFLAVLSAIAFVGFAYVGPIFFPADFAPAAVEIVETVELGGS